MNLEGSFVFDGRIDSTSETYCPVSGDAERAVDFAKSQVMPVIHEGLAQVCTSRTATPLTELQRFFRSQSSLRTARSVEVTLALTHDGNVLPTANDDGPISYSKDFLPLRPLPLSLVSRPCLMEATLDGAGALPSGFTQCGALPVFVSDLPTRSQLPTMIRHAVQFTNNTSAQEEPIHITWVMVSTEATVVTYVGEQPHKCTIDTNTWNQVRHYCSRNRSGGGGGGGSSVGEGLTLNGGSSSSTSAAAEPKPLKPKKSSTKVKKRADDASTSSRSFPLETVPCGVHPADAKVEKLFTKSLETTLGRKGNSMSLVDALQQHVASNNVADNQQHPIQQRVARLFHPADVAVSKPVIDELFTVLDSIVNATTTTTGTSGPSEEESHPPPPHVVFVVGCDQSVLTSHLGAIASIYFRCRADVAHWRRILNAAEQLRDKKFVHDFDKIYAEVQSRRERRDEMRAVIREAHIASMRENGLSQIDSFVEERNRVEGLHRERRREEDAKRLAVQEHVGNLAAVRVQSIMRGAMTRNRVAAANTATTTFPADPNVEYQEGTTPATTQVHESLTGDGSIPPDLENNYRRGRFPMLEGTMEYLQFVFGAQIVTNEVTRKGSIKRSTRWKRRVQRVAPVDEADVSSEEEVWEEEPYDRLTADGGGAINPMHIVDLVLSGVRSQDKETLFYAFANYTGVPQVQERAMQAMERIVHYLLFAVFANTRHRCREGDSPLAGPYASNSLLQLPSRLKNCETYTAFCATYRRPQEWLNQQQFVLLLMSNMIQPLCRTRHLIASAEAANGSWVEGVGRVDLLLQGSPIHLVPEGVTVDQIVELAGVVQRATPRCKKVYWFTTHPQLTVYVNGVPFFLMERTKKAVFTPQAQVAANLKHPLVAARINEVVPPVLVEKSCTRLSVQGSTSGTMPGLPSVALIRNYNAVIPVEQADHVPLGASGKMSPEVRNQLLMNQMKRKASMGGPLLQRRASMANRNPVAQSLIQDTVSVRKNEPSWLGAPWSFAETTLSRELMVLVESSTVVNPGALDGYLPCFTVSSCTITNRVPSGSGGGRGEEVEEEGLEPSSSATTPLWNTVRLQLQRGEAPVVDVKKIKVIQKPPPSTKDGLSSRSMRNSRSSTGGGSLYVTPRTSLDATTPQGSPMKSTTSLADCNSSSKLSVMSSANNSNCSSPISQNLLSVGPTTTTTGGSSSTTAVVLGLGRGKAGGSRRKVSLGSSTRTSEAGGGPSQHLHHHAVSDSDKLLQGLEQQLPVVYPTTVGEAIRTPPQAMEDVKERLKNAASEGETPCQLYARRVVLCSTFGDEWLKNLDSFLLSMREAMLDMTAAVVVTVSSNESVFHALFGAVLYETEVKSHVMARRASSFRSRGTDVGSMLDTSDIPAAPAAAALPQSDADGEDGSALRSPVASSSQHHHHATNSDGGGGGGLVASSSQALTPAQESVSVPLIHLTMETSQILASPQRAGAPQAAPRSVGMRHLLMSPGAPLPDPLADFPVLKCLSDDIPQIASETSAPFIIKILIKSNSLDLFYTNVLASMDAATHAASRNDWSACKHHCRDAVRSFQQFVLLIAFHSFLLYQAESTQQQQHSPSKSRARGPAAAAGAGGNQQPVAYFREFVASVPNLFHRLQQIDPWEGNTAKYPMGCPFGGAGPQLPSFLDGDHRWRSDSVMPNIG